MFTVIPCFSKVGTTDFEDEKLRPMSTYRKAYRLITPTEQSPPVLPDIPVTSPIKLDLIIPPLEEMGPYEESGRNVSLRRRSSMRKKTDRSHPKESHLNVHHTHRRSESNPEGRTKVTRTWNSWCASNSRELFFLDEERAASFYSHSEGVQGLSPGSDDRFMAFEELLTKREDCGDEITIKISLTPSLLK
ncbi:hypothetical protein K493DRAFT_359332 [Basidiobolus meristosporus CBS 931.73]|uniref:Uncharacterized protein n=1 Tax=Basidiobolus meristosporus CBS 931.73 TaxID=1314790 RepID=A0A1Y1XSV8_9FUNG|nr:hypothetical protein K493DRAFT_359332 [Basidiobolus meristosporus CBS 931.73]|eukprot:ORX88586.1 hypothetical protein K493DRAFT_359332 [Basidiobolus meristosporus CBS 931.73]